MQYKRTFLALLAVLFCVFYVSAQSNVKMVDLGLSVKWADRNLGADYPEDAGDPFAWGETETKPTSEFGDYSKWARTPATVATSFRIDANLGDLIEWNYNDHVYKLNIKYDAANHILGGKWRMPTDKEWRELKEKCVFKWIKNTMPTDNPYSLQIIGPNGNSIILPAASFRKSGNERYWQEKPKEWGCYYWTCIAQSPNYVLYFEVSRLIREYRKKAEPYVRRAVSPADGLYIRPVYDESQPAPNPKPLTNKPVLIWTSLPSVVNGSYLKLNVKVKSDSKIESSTVKVNGQSRGVSTVVNDGADFSITRDLTLQEGQNTITVEVANAAGTTSESRTVNYEVKRVSPTPDPKPTPHPTPSATQKRLALVIGNSAYQYATQLPNPRNDAKDIAAKLRQLGFMVIEREDVSQKDFYRAVSEFGSQSTDYDVSLFYYAGHAIESDGENYLIPIDARLERKVDLKSECVSANYVLGNLEEAKSRANIIVLDACRNNPITRGWSRGWSRGLAQMDAPSGTYIMFSTNPGNTADDGVGRNSPFTRAFLQCLDMPGLELGNFGKRVAQMVKQATGNRQQPWRSSSFDSDFYFNLK